MGTFLDRLKERLHNNKLDAVERNYRGRMYKDMLVQGAITIGNILEISNGYIILITSHDGSVTTAIYAPSLDKIGEVLAAHKTKHKFLHEPEKAYTLSNTTRTHNV
jgi:hypothetical protein